MIEMLKDRDSPKEADTRREMHCYFDKLITNHKADIEHEKMLAGGLGLEAHTEKLKELKKELTFLETAIKALKKESYI